MNKNTKEPEMLDAFEEAQEKLVVQSSDFSLSVVKQMVDSATLDLAPQYQRRARWSLEKKSQLIESFIMNVPVPPIYLAEEKYGVYSVIDGKQRLTAIVDYLSDDFKLRGLEKFSSLNGSHFSDLPEAIKRALQVRPYLRFITLLKQSDPELKYEVFTRLNRGGETLTDQEVRNAAFRGPLNDAIYELASIDFLRDRLKIYSETSSPYTKMLDAEYVLRFFVFAYDWRGFNGNMSQAMDSFMRDRQYSTDREISALRNDFTRALAGCRSIWGERAFQRPVGQDQWREQTIAGIFDAQMVAVHSLEDEKLLKLAEKSEDIQSATYSLFTGSATFGQEGTQFEDAVRTGTNTPSKVKFRITKMSEFLDSFLP